MEFLVEFKVTVPPGTPESEVKQREKAEAEAAAELAGHGNLVPLRKEPAGAAARTPIGLYRADSEAQLRVRLDALPLGDWLRVDVTPLAPHPNGPFGVRANGFQLPKPRLSPVYRLEATVGGVVELGDTPLGHRRIAPLMGGTFKGAEIKGTLLGGTGAKPSPSPDAGEYSKPAMAADRLTLMRDLGHDHFALARSKLRAGFGPPGGPNV
jgi:muconolactone D-isomerase